VKAPTAATNVTFFHLLQTANPGTPAMIASSPIHCRTTQSPANRGGASDERGKLVQPSPK
jgi:hypothetical protein